MDQRRELDYLERVKNEIKNMIIELGDSISQKKKEIIELRRALWQNIYEMDPAEIAFNNQVIDGEVVRSIDKKKALHKLEKMYLSPYFARIDFDIDNIVDAYYIGLGHFQEKNGYDILVYDWRAPISSLFYDYGVGKAQYQAPMGIIYGEIKAKYQYKVKDGEMVYMFDSSITVNDDILQKELSNNSSEKMRNIVASIQAEQNKIIRANRDDTLIVQGVAGSGKTSIALHRVAFLLYKYKDTLKSSNILIVSPSKVFSTYISDVLPELGEENIVEMSFEDIAINELSKIGNFERKFQHIDYILTNSNKFTDDDVASMKYKSSIEFVEHIKAFVDEITPKLFEAKTFEYKRCIVHKEKLETLYNYNFSKREPSIRMEYILDFLYETVMTDLGIKLSKVDKDEIKEQLMQMFKLSDIVNVYADMLRTLQAKGYPAIIKPSLFHCVEYEDVYPIILLKYHLAGVLDFQFVKHLVIDEMQDYTPVQYEIINKMFSCSKTILGDIMQIVDPYTNIGALETLQSMYEKSNLLKLMTSYRSSTEITNVAQSIVGDSSIEVVDRHSDKPSIIAATNIETICKDISSDIKFFKEWGYSSIAILCKTLTEAKDIYNYLKCDESIVLFSENDEVYKAGVIVTTSFIAKGLEFDCVIIPQVNTNNYCNASDRQSLYVSCTRALHQLKMYYNGKISPFLNNAVKQSLVELITREN